ncbi:MAG: hypothetical protein AAGF75_13915 [Cyanobacteria bacterium P01_H01_bin.130]
MLIALLIHRPILHWFIESIDRDRPGLPQTSSNPQSQKLSARIFPVPMRIFLNPKDNLVCALRYGKSPITLFPWQQFL